MSFVNLYKMFDRMGNTLIEKCEDEEENTVASGGQVDNDDD